MPLGLFQRLSRRSSALLLAAALAATGWIVGQRARFDASGDDPIESEEQGIYRNAERVLGVGVKVGEVQPDSAILWTRVPPRDLFDPDRPKSLWRAISNLGRDDSTRSRYRIARAGDLDGERWSDWREASVEDDYAVQTHIPYLEPGTEYEFEVDGADEHGRPLHERRRGRFRTAPARDVESELLFTVVTGQRFDRIDSRRGFRIYPAMQALDPDFLVLTGDTVYHDRGDIPALTVKQGRFRWRRMYELPNLYEFHAAVPAYWEKDDHDILQDDAYPGVEPYSAMTKSLLALDENLTFDSGLRLFRMHTPSDRPYRSVRWGRLAEVWFTEVREFRSPNNAPDGPGKTIFGAAQKAWLKESLRRSDAVWKILVNPTPIVGPDRAEGKADNHANAAFQTEGDEMRRFFAEELGEEFILIAGDRHWQYHSTHPELGVEEYGCGPASDAHAGGSPGFDEEYHRFHREAGGFLSLAVDAEQGRTRATIRIHNVNGGVEHEVVREQALD